MLFFVFPATSLNSTLQYAILQLQYSNYLIYPQNIKISLTILNFFFQISMIFYIFYRKKNQYRLIFVPLASVLQSIFYLLFQILFLFQNYQFFLSLSMVVECSVDLFMSFSILIIPFHDYFGAGDR